MYTVLFPNGNTLVFSVKALAETYVMAYRGVLISNPTVDGVIPETCCL
jgi:hypothetical protein